MIKNENAVKVDKNFRGLAIDCDGGLWIIGIDGAVYVDSSDTITIHSATEWAEAFKRYSPFTKYNGQLVLEND